MLSERWRSHREGRALREMFLHNIQNISTLKSKEISVRIKHDGDIHLFFSERFSDSVLSVI